MPTAHIYTFSRLVHAYPGNWDRLLTSMEEGKQFAFSYYLPMREAVVRLCASGGQNRQDIYNLMVARARLAGGTRGPKIARDNADAFDTFADVFLPRIGKFRRDLLRKQRTGCVFEGLTLEGGPHFEALDDKGRKRYVFLHPSNWSKPDFDAYLELLGIVVEDEYGADNSSLWVLDLRRGKEVKWRSKPRVRKRCAGAARLYSRLIRTMEDPADE